MTEPPSILFPLVERLLQSIAEDPSALRQRLPEYVTDIGEDVGSDYCFAVSTLVDASARWAQQDPTVSKELLLLRDMIQAELSQVEDGEISDVTNPAWNEIRSRARSLLRRCEPSSPAERE